jgi:hypothetical protein
MPEIHLYFDDTGSRKPDHKPPERSDGMDCFALGGFMVDEDKIPILLEAHAAFVSKWGITEPLHSTKIRGRKGQFGRLAGREEDFQRELTDMICGLPIVCHAAVIDRPGYVKRYDKDHKDKLWMMSKTAYTILVERAARYARSVGCRLRIFMEGSGPDADNEIRSFARELKSHGMPFHSVTSSSYEPFSAADFRSVILGEPKRVSKENALAQIADLILYPIARAGYVPDYRPYRALKDAGLLLDDLVEPTQRHRLGIKYSCFDEKQKAREADLLSGPPTRTPGRRPMEKL